MTDNLRLYRLQPYSATDPRGWWSMAVIHHAHLDEQQRQQYAVSVSWRRDEHATPPPLPVTVFDAWLRYPGDVDMDRAAYRALHLALDPYADHAPHGAYPMAAWSAWDREHREPLAAFLQNGNVADLRVPVPTG